MPALQAIRSWEQRRPGRADALLAGLLWLLLAPYALGGEADTLGRLALLTGLTAPLAWRRRAPLAAFGALAAVAFAQWLTTSLQVADLTLLIGLYSVAAYERRRWGFAAAVAVFELGVLLATARYTTGPSVLSFLALSAFVVAAGALGVYVRTRREHIAALTERARQLERQRDQQAQLAAAAERARIARELHDVVAHSLSVMIALADGARLTAARDAEAAEQAMGAVSSTGREALGEMRRLLGVLRTDEPPELDPQPGLDQLEPLAEQVRGAGLPVRLTCSGEPAELSAGAQLTVYRLVQEALTNTLKHGRAVSAAEVRLAWADDELAVEVLDDGAPVLPRERAPGHGIAGMRERAAAYGAALEAGPRPQGGWRVATRLPLPRPTGTAAA